MTRGRDIAGVCRNALVRLESVHAGYLQVKAKPDGSPVNQ